MSMPEEITPAEHRLVNILAWSMCRKSGPSCDIDDLKQEGYIALMEAKQKFDQKHVMGMSERNYHKFIIQKRIIDAIRRFDQFGRSKPEDRYELVPIEVPDDDYYYDKRVAAMSTKDNVEADIYESEVSSMVRQKVNSLPKRLRTVVHLYYYEDYLMKDIGKIIGKNESRVSQLLTEARLLLRSRLSRCAA